MLFSALRGVLALRGALAFRDSFRSFTNHLAPLKERTQRAFSKDDLFYPKMAVLFGSALTGLAIYENIARHNDQAKKISELTKRIDQLSNDQANPGPFDEKDLIA